MSLLQRVWILPLITLFLIAGPTGAGTGIPPGFEGPGVIVNSSDLPPVCNPQSSCGYVGPAEFHAMMAAGEEITSPNHHFFTNIVRTPTAGGEFEDFDTELDVIIDVGGGPQATNLVGPARIKTLNGGASTGLFDTEIISMSLTGNVGGIPVEIRESPSKQSLGKVQVQDIGGGLFQIDSFFDVFTELSVNGGPFEPQTNGPGRVNLPEPSGSLTLLAGVPLLYVLAGRRERKRG